MALPQSVTDFLKWENKNFDTTANDIGKSQELKQFQDEFYPNENIMKKFTHHGR